VSLSSLVNDLAARVATEFKTVRSQLATGLAGKADDTAVVKTSGDQSISGVKTFISGLIAPNPTQAGSPIRNDDTRLSDARTPTAHTHSTADITRTIPAEVAAANGATITPTTTADLYRARTTGATATLAVPSGTATDAEVLNVEVYATVALALTLAAGYVETGAITTSQSVAAGKVLHLALRYRSIAPAGWRVLAVTPDA
jgi:hypothetical protein